MFRLLIADDEKLIRDGIRAMLDWAALQIEIIGEASYMLSLEFKEKNNHIPWNDIIRMRHVLVHGYASILPELLWHTALIDVPVLKQQIAAILI